MSEKIRNHPTMLVGNTIVAVFVAAISCLNLFGSNAPMMVKVAIPTLVFAGLETLFILIWYSNWLTMEENQAVAEFKLIVHKRTVIPYAKVASVNIVRSLFNRIFGTSTICVNVNSAVNSARPEVSFVFKQDMAEQVYNLLKTGVFGNESVSNMESAEVQIEVEEDTEHEGALKFTLWDSFMYGYFGGNTFGILWSILWAAYSIYSAVNVNSGALLMSLAMLIFTSVLPMVQVITRYANFTIYREGDKLFLRHGLINIYSSEFEVRRINAIRIRRSLFARLMGKFALEAEVVGINAMDKVVTPVLCLLIDDKRLDDVLNYLVPEYKVDIPLKSPPSESRVPLTTRTAMFAMVSFIIPGLISLGLGMVVPEDHDDAVIINAMWWFFAVATIVIPIFVIIHAFFYHRICRLGAGKDKFCVVTGVVDRLTLIMPYDRVQITTTIESPAARRHGVARLGIHYLSTAGKARVESGFFFVEDIDEISDVVMDRLRSGEYDYRATEM